MPKNLMRVLADLEHTWRQYTNDLKDPSAKRAYLNCAGDLRAILGTHKVAQTYLKPTGENHD